MIRTAYDKGADAGTEVSFEAGFTADLVPLWQYQNEHFGSRIAIPEGAENEISATFHAAGGTFHIIGDREEVVAELERFVQAIKDAKPEPLDPHDVFGAPQTAGSVLRA